MIKMIALDLDGTLLGGTKIGYGIMPEALQALEEASKRGLRIGIVTGRDFEFIEWMLHDEGINPAKVGYPEVIIAEERFVFYLTDSGFAPDQRWNSQIETSERSLLSVAREIVHPLLEGELGAIDPDVMLVDEDLEERRGFMEMVFSSVEAAQAAEALLRDICVERSLDLVPIRNIRGISVRHKDSSKGAVLDRVAKQLGLDPSEIVAVGDSENDRSMLDGRFGFKAATTSNGEPAIRELVHARQGYVATAGYGAGVAEIISKILGDDERFRDSECSLRNVP